MSDEKAGKAFERKFIEGICQQPTLEATNGVRYVDIVPRESVGGVWPGPVVVRPEYYAIYEEIKYRQ